ncbi:SAM hydroxide adenosyltransferase [Kribbella sp. NPDC049227]|uniref:SAM hydroxide adenosyltransferase n=1 Tax=Kribbella sp. NPDC049227 TaxID=3364113 RepID=UPI00371D4DC3
MYPITYVTDCFGGNARARLSTRIGALFGQSPTIVAADGPDPESFAALTLLDCLRSTESLGEDGHPTITLVNIAPRDGEWPNGAPFCFFTYGRHLVASTFDARTLSLVRRELGIDRVHVTDIREVVAAARDWAEFRAEELEKIADTQFRSLWYLPLLAKWLTDGHAVPSTPTAVPVLDDAEPTVSVVDNFGNCKLDCGAAAIGFSIGASVPVAGRTQDGSITLTEVGCYRHLTDVPLGAAGLILGSSGTDFVELVIRGGSAASAFNLRPGDSPLRSTPAEYAA